MRESLRAQFELKNSSEELRTQLEEWEEDKQWKAREERNRRANAERNLPNIPEGRKLAISKMRIPEFLKISEQMETNATKNSNEESNFEFENLKNEEQAGDISQSQNS